MGFIWFEKLLVIVKGVIVLLSSSKVRVKNGLLNNTKVEVVTKLLANDNDVDRHLDI